MTAWHTDWPGRVRLGTVRLGPARRGKVRQGNMFRRGAMRCSEHSHAQP